MKTTEVLTRAEASVKLVEAKLAELKKLENDKQALAESIEETKQSEADILAGSQAEESKVKALLKVRTTLEVRQSNLAKLTSAIDAAKDDVRAAGDRANLFFGALYDALIVATRARLVEQLKAIFIPRAIPEIQKYLAYSIAVDQIEKQIGRSHTPAQIRQAFDKLRALAESEENLEVITSESWSEPVTFVRQENTSGLGTLV
jgi:hypothetical protein